jgi:hypothetical protein
MPLAAGARAMLDVVGKRARGVRLHRVVASTGLWGACRVWKGRAGSLPRAEGPCGEPAACGRAVWGACRVHNM